MNETSEAAPKKTVERSPRFPFVPLSKALERAKQLHEKEGKNAVQLPILAAHWGYQPKSSGVRQTIGALRAFGLLEEQNGGLKLTDRALRILRDVRLESPDRDSLIREAALLPPIHAKLWKKFNVELPSNANLGHLLTFDEGFNPGSVSDFIAEYRATLAFSKLDKSDSMPPGELANGEAKQIEIGDSVSWESQGVMQFVSRKVTGFSEDGAWAFVEGSNTGVPLSELSLTEKAIVAAPKPLSTQLAASLRGGMTMNPSMAPTALMAPTAPMAPAGGGFRQDIFTLSEGDAVLRWPSTLSPDSFQDLEDWLKLMLRKAKRSVVAVDLSRVASMAVAEMSEGDSPEDPE